MSAQSTHLSIGEVLSLVQEDFPDVTISKIRFLESQGLIAPERTGSGFRKFYDADIERLRWILRQQSDHFLPLKVIKKMLEDGVDYSAGVQTQPTLWSADGSDSSESSSAEDTEQRGESPQGRSVPRSDPRRSPSHPAVASSAAASSAASSGAAEIASSDSESRLRTEANREGSGRSESAERGELVQSPDGTENHGSSPKPRASIRDSQSLKDTSETPKSRSLTTPADVVAALQEGPASQRLRRGGVADNRLGTPGTAVSDSSKASGSLGAIDAAGGGSTDSSALMSAEELCEQCGIEAAFLESLEQFGLVTASSLGGHPAYDAAAVDVVRLASRYAAMGVEPRHLRMYKIAAEREAGFIEQLVVPLLKQKNPTARQNASQRCEELTKLGAELHAKVLRQKLHRVLGQ